ncbi:MAG: hypothetical protein M1828_005167 [Chrysothrix sp. TS-e1954]|nr:MAG: hypothetical protein M1828_005167 [Chrysothrix sp. TS-e1954]
MKFLCIPGAISNAETFKIQLAPFIKELESDGTAEFYFTQGDVDAPPPPGSEDYFGPGPHRRFLEYDGQTEVELVQKLQDFPEEATAEDTLRKLLHHGEEAARVSVHNALDKLHRVMDEEGPFEGVLGYSEGATLASTLLLYDEKRRRSDGRERRLKCGLFFAGWPPIDLDGNSLALSDECGQVIDVPTCHVLGAIDPFLQGVMALYNVCNPENASLFDHGQGHTLPRDPEVVKELGETVRMMIRGLH